MNKPPNFVTPHEKFWSLSNKLTKIRDQDLVENLKTTLLESRKPGAHFIPWNRFFLWDDIIYIYIYLFLQLPNDPILKGESLVFPKNTCHFSTLMRVGDECHPLKKNITQKKKVIDYHHSELLGVMFKVPPHFGITPFPKTPQKTK